MGAHLERIREYVKIIANNLAGKPEYKSQIGENFIRDIYFSCILHDIGKVGIPDCVLLKPGRLDPKEQAIIQQHPGKSGELSSKRIRAARNRHVGLSGNI